MFGFSSIMHKQFCLAFFKNRATILGRFYSWVVSFWCKCTRFEDCEIQLDSEKCEKVMKATWMEALEESKAVKPKRFRTVRFGWPTDSNRIVDERVDYAISLIQQKYRKWRNDRLALVSSLALTIVLGELRSRDHDFYQPVRCQAIIRGWLARRIANKKREKLLNYCRWLSKSDSALVSVARGKLARLRFQAQLKIKNQNLNTFRNTSFPRIGFENLDGCDCWLIKATDPLPKNLLRLVFYPGVTYRSIAGKYPTWVVGETYNGEQFVIEEIEGSYFIYLVANCHQQEGVEGWRQGHLAREVVIVRQEGGDLVVLKHREHVRLRDLSLLVQDQHQHVALARSILYVSEPTVPSGQMRWMGNELVTLEEKQRARRERRAQDKLLREQGLKKKKIQLPYRYQGLRTSQEYWAVKEREMQEAAEALQDRGSRSLPQEVKEYLKSPRGSEQWLNIHAWAIDRSDFARTQLAKLNNFLFRLGLTVPLEMNGNIIENQKKERERTNKLRQKQIEARDVRNARSLNTSSFDAEVLKLRSKEKALHKERWGDFSLIEEGDDEIGPEPEWYSNDFGSRPDA